MAMNWRTRTVSVAKWSTAVFLALVLAMVGINYFDEELSPTALELLKAPVNPYAPEENIYLAILGFSAKSGMDPISLGKELLAEYEKELAIAKTNPYHFVEVFSARQRAKKLKIVGEIDFCEPSMTTCLAEVATKGSEVANALLANDELYRRYLALHRLKGYYEIATPSHFDTSPNVPSTVQRLFLASVATRVTSGTSTHRKAAISELRDDILTWKRVLAGTGSVISEMLSTAYLRRDYALLAQIIADEEFDLENVTEEILSSLDLSNEGYWNTGSAFPREYRSTAFSLEQLRLWAGLSIIDHAAASDMPWWEIATSVIENYFFKLNASQNLNAQRAEHLVRMAGSGPSNFRQMQKAYRNWSDSQLRFGLRWVYNPVGRDMNLLSSDLYQKVVSDGYDVVALQRLVRLGFEIRRNKVADGAISDFMSQHPQWSSHPVGGSAFVWDGKTRTIAVQPLMEHRGHKQFTIPVWNSGKS